MKISCHKFGKVSGERKCFGVVHILGIVFGLLLLAACSFPTQNPTPAPATPDASSSPDSGGSDIMTGKAPVEEVELLMLESFPVQVHTIARGNLPDGCTTIDKINQSSDPTYNIFWVEIITARPADATCTEALVPFEETIPLNVYGLDAGTYTVDVNGVTASFTLDVDNVPPPVTGLATVESVEIERQELLTSSVSVRVQGTLPDACTEIGQINQGRDMANDRLWVEIMSSRPADMACAEVVTPFAETVPLDVERLPAGTYTVDVNGVTAEFTLEADNGVPTETVESTATLTLTPTLTPEPEVVGVARLASMDIQVSGSQPVRATVIAKGNLPDGCTKIGPVNQRRDVEANKLWMEITLVRTGDDVCTEALVPFEESFELDLSNLPAGEYTVDVNGIEGSIVLGVDNTGS